MLHTINSNALTVTVSEKGAELQSIKTNAGEEYLWQGDPAYWGSRAPVLFPAIGKSKDGAYHLNGAPYNMEKHGFVRAAAFTCTEKTANGLTLEYCDNETTRASYPFAFAFQAAFALSGSALEIEYRVRNRSDGVMYFAAGAHEAYRCPCNGGEAFGDYFIEFETDGTYKSFPVSGDGLLLDDSYTVIENGRVLPLNYGLFENDALIFKHIPAKRLSVKNNKTPAAVTVAYNSEHLGIWTKPGAPFICIEPWWGLPDRADADGDFACKEGNVKLAAGAEYTCTHSITIT